MVAIVRTNWEGTSGGPGLTQMAVLGSGSFGPAEAQAAVNAVRKFWDAIKGFLPTDLTLTVLSVVDVYDQATGELTGSVTAPITPLAVVGTNNSSYAGGVGAKVTWNTGAVLFGRRVRGSTYLVPLASTNFTTNGTIVPASATTVNTSATTMINDLINGGTLLLVWSRPQFVEGAMTRPGTVTPVSSGTCSTKSAILRGRRD